MKNNEIASEWTETLINEMHTHGKRRGRVSGDRWRLGVWNARGVNDLNIRELLETMHVRKIGSQGVGSIMNEKARQYLKDNDFVSSRLLWARMKVEIRRLFIIAFYAPADSDPREVKDAFWDTLKNTISTCDQGQRIILLGDMNKCESRLKIYRKQTCV